MIANCLFRIFHGLNDTFMRISIHAHHCRRYNTHSPAYTSATRMHTLKQTHTHTRSLSLPHHTHTRTHRTLSGVLYLDTYTHQDADPGTPLIDDWQANNTLSENTTNVSAAGAVYIQLLYDKWCFQLPQLRPLQLLPTHTNRTYKHKNTRARAHTLAHMYIDSIWHP